MAMALGGGTMINNVVGAINTGAKGLKLVTGVAGALTQNNTATGLLAGGIAGSTIEFDESGGGNGEVDTECDAGKGKLVCKTSVDKWNYTETITTTFESDTLVCHKCTRSANCTNPKNPLWGGKWCKQFADPVETCTDTQF